MSNVKFGHVAGFAALICCALLFAENVKATSGGSWGSRGIAGGSWGAGSRGGLLSGRAPVRNLLGRAAFGAGRVVNAGRQTIQSRPRILSRLGSRLAGRAGGSVGSFGGSIGGSGSVGSYSGYSCIGSSYTRLGGSVGSSVVGSYGCTGNSYANSSSGASYGSWGSSYVSTIDSSYNAPIVSSAPINNSYPTSFEMPYVEPGISTGFGMVGSSPVISSAPMLDSGYSMPLNAGIIDGGMPIQGMEVPMGSTMPIESGIQPGIYGDPNLIQGAIPMGDTGTIQGDIPIEGTQLNGTFGNSSFNDSFSDPGVIYESNDPPNSIIEPGGGNLDGISTPPVENGFETPPMPQPSPDNEETNYKRQSPANSAVLNLKLPRDAKVYINDRLTKTPGSDRSYVSKRLKNGKGYEYRVKAVLNREGNEIVRTRTVKLVPGMRKKVAFDFDRPAITTLAVKVPSDAKVTLAGNETTLKGKTRYFSTRTLADGKSWSDYKIQVSVVRNGKTVTREKSIDIESGQTRLVAFDFATDQIVAR